MDDSDSDDDYSVGYQKPPRQHQFKKGQSGNPRGRPKGRSAAGVLDKGLNNLASMRIETVIDGRRRRLPFMDAHILRLGDQAIKGDIRASRTLTDLYSQSERRQSKRADEFRAQFAARLQDQRPISEVERRALRKRAVQIGDPHLIGEIESALEGPHDGREGSAIDRLREAVNNVKAAKERLKSSSE